MLMTCGLVSAEDAPSPFQEGTQTLSLSASYIPPIRFSEDELLGVEFGLGYYFAENHQINLEFQGYYSDDRDYLDGGSGDVLIGGVGLLGRWHFLPRQNWSLFLDGGGSVTQATRHFPAEGTHFNLTGKIGLGASLRLGDATHLMGGARYFHLSNGQIRKMDDNPSYDGIQIWVGVMWMR